MKQRGGYLSNQKFYSSIEYSELNDVAQKAGLATGCDIDFVLNYMDQSPHYVLNVGACLGRVEYAFDVRGLPSSLTSVEINPSFAELIKSQNFKKNLILNNDIFLCHFDLSFDLVLILWSGISDFDFAEQVRLIAHLSSFLAPGGLIFIDNLFHDQKIEFTQEWSDQTFFYSCDNGVEIQGYVPSCDQMQAIALENNLDLHNEVYQTSTNKSRLMHIFKKRSL